MVVMLKLTMYISNLTYISIMEINNYIKKSLRESLSSRIDNQEEIDAILDKIGRQNFDVTPKDRIRLDRYTGNKTDVSGIELSPHDDALMWVETITADLEAFEHEGHIFLNCDRLGGFGIITPPSNGGRSFLIIEQLTYALRKKFRMSSDSAYEVLKEWVRDNLGISDVVRVQPMQNQPQ